MCEIFADEMCTTLTLILRMGQDQIVSHVVAVVMFALSLTIYEIFEVKMSMTVIFAFIMGKGKMQI